MQIKSLVFAAVLTPMISNWLMGAELGTILREEWSGISGTNLSALTSSPSYANPPQIASYLTSFDAPMNVRDNYGVRIRGCLHPTQSGSYRFWIAGDDECQLWLSPNNQPLQKRLIAHAPAWTAPQEWTRYTEQQSVVIELTAGVAYYIEALHKEGNGGDHISVAWTGPGLGSTPVVIQGGFLSPAVGAPPAIPTGRGTGTIVRESWAGISGSTVSSLTSSDGYPQRPTTRETISAFEATSDAADNYGSRIRGYLCPAISGDYTFWIASDDEGQLYLSSDKTRANAVLIASVPSWTNSHNWDVYPQQKSTTVTLVGGKRYYIEALHKEGRGGDNLSVAWEGPSLARGVISGKYLSPFDVPIISGNSEFSTNTTVSITSTIAGGSIHYSLDGTAPSAASPTYSAPLTLTASAIVRAVHVASKGGVGEIAERVFVATGSGTGLFGSYYAHNRTFTGTPVTRIDPALDFTGTDSYIIPNIGPAFSARWTGLLETRFAEPYTLIVTADDGVVVSVNGVVVISAPTSADAPSHSYVITNSQAGKKFAVQIDYNQLNGPGFIKLEWQSPSEGRKLIPTTALYPIDPGNRTPATSLTLQAPAHTYLSPACIEGTYASVLPGVTTSEYTAEPNVLGDHMWFANVPLLTGVTNDLTVQEGLTSIESQITWDIIAIDAPQIATLSARVADSVALESISGSGLSILHPDGTTTTLSPSLTTRYVTFDAPGVWTISAAGASASLVVGVYDGTFRIDSLHPLAIEQNIQYDIDMSLYSQLHPNAANLLYVSQDTGLTVSSQPGHILVKGNTIGTRYGSVRLGAINGPILAPITVTCFTLTGWGNVRSIMSDGSALPAYSGAGEPQLVDVSDGNGQARRRITLTMTPYVPNVTLFVTKFAHPTSFSNGYTNFSVVTDGSASSIGEPGFTTATIDGQQVGQFAFDLFSQNGAPATYCLRHSTRTNANFYIMNLSYPVPITQVALK